MDCDGKKLGNQGSVMTSLELAAKLVSAASKLSGVSCAGIIGDRRTRGLPAARWACWVAMRHHGCTFQEIGTIFMDRCHSTIMHGVTRANRLRAKSQAYDQICENLIILTKPNTQNANH